MIFRRYANGNKRNGKIAAFEPHPSFVFGSDGVGSVDGSPEGSDFYVPGLGGVLICKDGKIHPKQSRLEELV